ncbi:hypothetical protein [Yeguia hominis]|uniref:Uncharacterized protein n=1 Tax=Yeguia hominis TaxID=2763662 RepID=A0A926D949_9FIRM|nr:hypothetical protein [Yeguia hominis]MBC8533713.1 hypothetical protein [Yeguia hominis]
MTTTLDEIRAPVHETPETGIHCISGLQWQSQNSGKMEGLAVCNSQTASPFGGLNYFLLKDCPAVLGG